MDVWDALATLNEPKRRMLLDLVREARRPLTRDALVAMSGLPRATVAFHLERLSAAGLLRADFAREPGRGGPGAGRPAKRYQLSDHDLMTSFPERRYETVAAILSRGVGVITSVEAAESIQHAASEHGRAQGQEIREAGQDGSGVPPGSPLSRRTIVGILHRLGYRPATKGGDRGRVTLRNCPFAKVSLDSPEVVCPVNQQYLQGMLDELSGGKARAVLDGDAEDCCVTVWWPPPDSRSGGWSRSEI